MTTFGDPVPALPRKSLASKVMAVAGLFAVCAGLQLGHSFFVPLAFAILLALILSPLVALGERLRLPRSVSVITVVVLVFGIVGFMGYFIAAERATLWKKLPEYRTNALAKLESLRVPFAQTLKYLQDAEKDVHAGMGGAPPKKDILPGDAPVPLKVEVVEGPSDPFKVASAAFPHLLTAGGFFSIVLLLVIFFLIYKSDIRDRIVRLAGDAQVNMTTQTITEATRGVSRYLFLQVIVNASYGVALGVGLYVLGVPGAFLWGVFAAVLRFVPYLGPIGAGVLPVLLSFGVFPGWAWPLLVAGYIIVLELISNNLVEPLVYGNRTGLSPLAVVLAAVFWAWMWGAPGLVLAVPLTVCLVSLGKYAPSLRFLPIAFGNAPAFEAKVQVYHRLLGRHPEEAAELLEKEAAGKPLAEFYDGVVLPVLRMAETDLQQGTLDEEKGAVLFASLRGIVDDLAESARTDLDKATPAEASTGQAPEPGKATVLCLPASERGDELSAHMLTQVLNLRGPRAKALAVEKMPGESMETVRTERADLVVICTSPLSNLLRARHLYKQLRRRFGDIPVVEGVWGGGDAQAIEGRIAPDGKALIVSSFSEAEKAIRELLREAAVQNRIPMGAAGDAVRIGTPAAGR